MDSVVQYATILARQYQGQRSRSRGRRLARGALAGIIIGCILFVLCAALCLWFCCCRKRRSKRQANYVQPAHSGGFLSRFRGGRSQPVHHGHHGHPGMQEAGYGYGPQHPQPTYR